MTTQQGRLQAKLHGRCLCLAGRRQGETLGWPCPPFAPGLGALTHSAASARRHPCARSSDPVLQQGGVGLRPGFIFWAPWFGGEGLDGKPGGTLPEAAWGGTRGAISAGGLSAGPPRRRPSPGLTWAPRPAGFEERGRALTGARARSCLWGRDPRPRGWVTSRPWPSPRRPRRPLPRRPGAAVRPARPPSGRPPPPTRPCAGPQPSPASVPGRRRGPGPRGGQRAPGARGRAGRAQGGAAPEPHPRTYRRRRGGGGRAPEAVPGGWASWEWHGRVPGEARGPAGPPPGERAPTCRPRRGGAAGAARRPDRKSVV